MSHPATSDPTSTPPSNPPTPSLEVLHHGPIRWLKPAAVVGLVTVAVVVGAGLLSRGKASQNLAEWTAAEAVPTVDLVRPDTNLGAQSLVLPGQVQAFYDAQIHARVNGYLKQWFTDIGAPVKQGQVLAVIDTPDLDQQLAQAKADLTTAIASQKLAKTTATRWQKLMSDDAVSKQDADEKASDLDAKTSLVNAAQANVQRLEALEGFKRITAPFDGVVTGRNTDVGALIAAGNPTEPPLFTVSDVRRLRIYVKAPQSYSAEMHPGMTATLTVPEHPNQTYTATLVTTTGAVSDQSGTMTVELQADNSGGVLKPGDYAQVSFDLPATTGAVRLPASALIFRQTGMAVATLGPGNRVVMKPVTISRDLGSTVEIAGGIGPQDRVIDNPPDSLAPGEVVRMAVPPAAGAAREG